MKFLIRLWWKTCALVRRIALAAIHVNDPWDGGILNLESPAVRRMLARAIWANRREVRGARIVRRFSNDPVVERRERWVEQQKLRPRKPLRLVV